jgi:hypothetical protein
MQDFSKQWSNVFQSINQPIKALTELNIKTFNKLLKNDYLDNCIQAKKPEEFISAQVEWIKDVSSDAIKYGQEALKIWLDAVSDFTHHSNPWVSEIAKSVSTADKGSKS